MVKPQVSRPLGLFSANASRMARTPSNVCQLLSSRGCNFTSLDTSQGVVRIIMQKVTNRPPINDRGTGPGLSNAAGKVFNSPGPANIPAPDNAVFLINERLCIFTSKLRGNAF